LPTIRQSLLAFLKASIGGYWGAASRGLKSPCGHEEPPERTGGHSTTALLTAVLRTRGLGANKIGSGQQGSGKAVQGLYVREERRVAGTTAINPTVLPTRWTRWSCSIIVARRLESCSVADIPRHKRIVVTGEQEDSSIRPCLGVGGLASLVGLVEELVPGSRLACMQQYQPSCLLCASANLCIPRRHQKPYSSWQKIPQKCFGRGTEQVGRLYCMEVLYS
jgi:hypothetical protein